MSIKEEEGVVAPGTTSDSITKPDGVFAGRPYYNCSNDTFSKCIHGKKKHCRVDHYVKDTDLYKRVKGQKDFMLRNASTGEIFKTKNWK